MTRHVLDSVVYSVVHSNGDSLVWSLEDLKGAHSGVWVFDVQEYHIAVPEPWAGPGFTDHRDMHELPVNDSRKIRVAIAATWTDGFLTAGGTGRLYYDGRFDPSTSAEDQERELHDLEQGPPQGPRFAKPEGDDSRTKHKFHQGLLDYLFTGNAGGPLSKFASSIDKWLPSAVTTIDIRADYPHDHGANPAAEPADNQQSADNQRFTIEVSRLEGSIGTLVLQPQWSDGGRRIRVVGRQPPFRDDLYVAKDLVGTEWQDRDFPKLALAGSGFAELSDVHWEWSAVESKSMPGSNLPGKPD